MVLYARDRTETTAQVWMGLTAGCAVCHDHKFDRFSQREFYELSAFFNNTTQNAMDGNIKDTPPTIFVPRPEDRQRWAASSTELAGFKKQLDERRQAARADFDRWLADATPDALNGRIPSDGLRLHAGLSEGSGNTINVTVGGQVRPVSLASEIAWKPGRIAAQAYNSQPGCTIELPEPGDLEKDQAFSFGAWVNAAKIDQSGAIMARMDDANGYRGWDFWFENGKPGVHIIHQWPDDALKVVATNPVKAGEWNHLFITYDGSGKASGVKIYVNGVLQPARPQADKLKNTIKTTVPLKVAQRHAGSRLNDVSIQDLRLYGRALPQAEAMQLVQASRAAWLAAKPADQRSEAEKNELFDWWLGAIDQPSKDLAGQIAALEQEQAGIKSRGAVAHVMQERDAAPAAYVLFRGEYDKRRDQVGADTPDALPPMPADLPKNRLGLAQWLLRPNIR